MPDKKNNPNVKKDNNNIEVISGNGKGLDISPVYDHIKLDKPSKKTDKNKKIVIPKSK